MKICIAGWYFREKFMRDIAASGYEAFVVKHREGDTHGIPSTLYDNVGLEFGAYRDYVQNHWDGQSDVLFLHDDTELLDLDAIHQAAELCNLGIDHAYIFSSAYEELVNGGAHGRAIWMRAEAIQQMKWVFPVDTENTGQNIGLIAQKGITDFHKLVTKISADTAVAAIIPGFSLGHRGTMNDKLIVFKRTNAIPGRIINVE